MIKWLASAALCLFFTVAAHAVCIVEAGKPEVCMGDQGLTGRSYLSAGGFLGTGLTYLSAHGSPMDNDLVVHGFPMIREGSITGAACSLNSAANVTDWTGSFGVYVNDVLVATITSPPITDTAPFSRVFTISQSPGIDTFAPEDVLVFGFVNPAGECSACFVICTVEITFD